MLIFIYQASIILLRFSGSLAENNELCTTRPTLVNLNPNELCQRQSYECYYPFMVTLDRCNGSCNTIDDPSMLQIRYMYI